MSLQGRDKTGKARICCTASKESGSCSHGRKYYVEDIEALPNMSRPIEPSENALRAMPQAAGYGWKRAGEIGREIDRLVDAIATGSAPAAPVGKRLQALEAEQLTVQNDLDRLVPSADVVALHPAAVSRYLAQVEDLSKALTVGGDISTGSPARAFRELVESVVVFPVAPREPLQIEVKGYLAELTNDRGLKPACRLSGGIDGSGGPLQRVSPEGTVFSVRITCLTLSGTARSSAACRLAPSHEMGRGS